MFKTIKTDLSHESLTSNDEMCEVFGPITNNRSSIVMWTASDIGRSILIYMKVRKFNVYL
jgi:hypothetical protein